MRRNQISTFVWLTLTCLVMPLCTVAAEPLRFNRDIRPILSGQCFACHGPDSAARKGGLRLDRREQAVQAADSGEIAIVPEKPEASALVQRILANDPAEVMPPPGSNKSLTPEQKELLKRWVAEGAVYESHWSLIPPRRSEPPAVKRTEWARNSIDRFILGRLEQEGLEPSPEADRRKLFRRLSLDLTGLPPTPVDVDAFEREMAAAEGAAADAVYRKWIDKLLDSPHFGERMAVDWLDAARFADSNGYQVDRDREMYAWRDWVIAAFNANKPFDEFTIEQIAGDLLPGATLSQRIATGFHRNHMLNEEGGVIADEFLTEYCADRVETTAAVWLGQTFNCARCHDHKFDPFTQRDYYRLYAFFNGVTEEGIGKYGANIRRNAPPMIKLPAPEIEARVASLQKTLDESKKQLAETDAASTARQPDWEARLRDSSVRWQAAAATSARVASTDVPVDAEAKGIRVAALEPGTHAVVIDVMLPSVQTTALRLECAPIAGTATADDAAAAPVPFQIGPWRVLRVQTAPAEPQPLAIRAAETEGALAAAEVAKALDPTGKSRAAVLLKQDPVALIVELESALAVEPPATLRLELSIVVKDKTAPWSLRVDATDTEVELFAPAEVVAIVRKETAQRSPEEQKRIAEFHLSKRADHRRLTDQVASLTKQIDEADLQIPTTLVMEERETPRPTHILIRGAYNLKGEEVTAGTPEALPGMSPDLPRNRLGLARWLVDPANPLPARVTVSRFWQLLFGTGLVRTAEDFGTQGEPPTHPELLDWLASEFVHSGWNVKDLLRLVVTSATYRQSSRLTPVLRERDPENRLLGRGPRFRLQAEFLRDQALAASGLLVPTVGGPSVRPYHPPGLYEQVVAGSSSGTYVVGKGTDLYRRSLYTYWKRSVPNPAMLVFDAPFREACTLKRSRTNTPLQALNLMNDPTYVEAARFLGQRMIAEGGQTSAERIAHGYRLALARSPRPAEQAILAAAYERALSAFKADTAGAIELLKVGDSSVDSKLDPAELAAMTTIATTILNLDETVMRE